MAQSIYREPLIKPFIKSFFEKDISIPSLPVTDGLIMHVASHFEGLAQNELVLLDGMSKVDTLFDLALGDDYTQGNAAARPIFLPVSALTNFPTLDFNTCNVLGSSDTINNTVPPITILLSGSGKSSATQIIFSFGNISVGTRDAGVSVYKPYASFHGVFVYKPNSFMLSENVFRVLTYIIKSNNDIEFQVNGLSNETVSGIGPPNTGGATDIGNAFTNICFTEELGEIIIYNRELTPTELTDMQTYMGRWLL